MNLLKHDEYISEAVHKNSPDSQCNSSGIRTINASSGVDIILDKTNETYKLKALKISIDVDLQSIDRINIKIDSGEIWSISFSLLLRLSEIVKRWDHLHILLHEDLLMTRSNETEGSNIKVG